MGEAGGGGVTGQSWNLVDRVRSYNEQYPLVRRWYLRIRILLLGACCAVGRHHWVSGYSCDVWCWLCGARRGLQFLSPSAKTDQGDSGCLKLETGHQVSTPEELCLTTSCARLNGDEVFSAFVFGLELAVALVMAYFVFALLGEWWSFHQYSHHSTNYLTENAIVFLGEVWLH